MLENLKQFVPSEVCLSCDGCCRFKEAKSVWRPQVSAEEIHLSKKKGLADIIFSKTTMDPEHRIKTVSCKDGENICYFFTPETNTCKIYEFRPFECRLYPFVLRKSDSVVSMTVHKLCPFIEQQAKTEEFSKYAAYLKDFFQHQDVIDFVQKHSLSLSDYHDYQDELEYLFTVCSPSL
ncbi:MAG: YkgJ family cysteine cluster protein [Candidatus Omnitrophota bacterium]